MNLQAIKGQVTGRQRGKSMLVRSLSGIGETAAMMVGAPNANSAFSEDDLLRMLVANNIGNGGEEQIMQMLTMEHIVVSFPAGTEIYIVFEKSAGAGTSETEKAIQIPHERSGFSQSANAVHQWRWTNLQMPFSSGEKPRKHPWLRSTPSGEMLNLCSHSMPPMEPTPT